jgi:hypothetical protein
MNLTQMVNELETERKQVQSELGRLDAAIDALTALHTSGSNGIVSFPKKRTMSAASRKAISVAQKARWARVNGQGTPKPKRVMSASARRKIAAAQRARWAAWKANQKKAA